MTVKNRLVIQKILHRGGKRRSLYLNISEVIALMVSSLIGTAMTLFFAGESSKLFSRSTSSVSMFRLLISCSSFRLLRSSTAWSVRLLRNS